MYNQLMTLKFFNLYSSAHHEEECTFHSDEPLITMCKDLLDNSHKVFNFKHDAWIYFRDTVLDNISDINNIGLGLKAERAIKRNIKGTSKGTHVVYRDKDNLIWHVFITFEETISF